VKGSIVKTFLTLALALAGAVPAHANGFAFRVATPFVSVVHVRTFVPVVPVASYGFGAFAYPAFAGYGCGVPVVAPVVPAPVPAPAPVTVAAVPQPVVASDPVYAAPVVAGAVYSSVLAAVPVHVRTVFTSVVPVVRVRAFAGRAVSFFGGRRAIVVRGRRAGVAVRAPGVRVRVR
jgi:hypothetical protein